MVNISIQNFFRNLICFHDENKYKICFVTFYLFPRWKNCKIEIKEPGQTEQERVNRQDDTKLGHIFPVSTKAHCTDAELKDHIEHFLVQCAPPTSV